MTYAPLDLEIPHFVPVRAEYNEYPVRNEAKRKGMVRIALQFTLLLNIK